MSIKDNITCKVVLVGESGVGKTSIINRYINNDFNENEQATLGPIYKNKVIQYPKYNKVFKEIEPPLFKKRGDQFP